MLGLQRSECLYAYKHLVLVSHGNTFCVLFSFVTNSDKQQKGCKTGLHKMSIRYYIFPSDYLFLITLSAKAAKWKSSNIQF